MIDSKPTTASALLSSAALAEAARRARAAGRPVLVSQTVRLPSVDPLELFARAASVAPDRFYWERPASDLAVVGVGIGHVVAADGPGRFQEAARAWRRLLDGAVIVEEETSRPTPGPSLVGGFSFDPEGPRTSLWRPFGAGRLVLPSITLTRADGVCWLALNLVVDPTMDLEPAARRLEADARSLLSPDRHPVPDGIGELILADDRAAGEAWKGLVGRAVRAIDEGAFEKVVLARAVNVQASTSFSQSLVLRHLRAQEPDCAVFAVGRAERCFLGATPEQLVRLDGDRVQVDCLAGTMRRGETPADDRQVGRALLTDRKERAEHAIVVRMAEGALADVCVELDVPAEPRLRLNRRLQHLHTPLAGRVAPGVDVLALVDRLHPTPAVGGAPREAALAFIREHEGFDRGWYAGPIGWVDRHGGGDFVVGLRSALLYGAEDRGERFTTARLFAGCGIVAASEPASELAEAGLKLQPMLAALRCSGAP
jgi:isochorismate synthase